jgi:hypothetical protein
VSGRPNRCVRYASHHTQMLTLLPSSHHLFTEVKTACALVVAAAPLALPTSDTHQLHASPRRRARPLVAPSHPDSGAIRVVRSGRRRALREGRQLLSAVRMPWDIPNALAHGSPREVARRGAGAPLEHPAALAAELDVQLAPARLIRPRVHQGLEHRRRGRRRQARQWTDGVDSRIWCRSRRRATSCPRARGRA